MALSRSSRSHSPPGKLSLGLGKLLAKRSLGLRLQHLNRHGARRLCRLDMA